MNIEVTEAREQEKSILQNLARFYVYDLSEFTGWPCRDDGLFGMNDLSEYWEDKTKFPFLIKVDSELAGFTLVNRWDPMEPEATCEAYEFFILRRFRRRGVGRYAAETLFELFPGRWLVAQLPRNKPAIAFWRNVIDHYTGGHYEENLEYSQHHGKEMNILRFVAKQERYYERGIDCRFGNTRSIGD
ncbi:MAG: GNAT family N-acetyltransferase [Sedimentisphaerales bacterium]|nr:GNAT family N-acetyltransferase [Sedimentisphaerales bacterium]